MSRAKSIREQLGASQIEMAQLFHTTRVQIHSIENLRGNEDQAMGKTLDHLAALILSTGKKPVKLMTDLLDGTELLKKSIRDQIYKAERENKHKSMLLQRYQANYEGVMKGIENITRILEQGNKLTSQQRTWMNVQRDKLYDQLPKIGLVAQYELEARIAVNEHEITLHKAALAKLK